MTALGSFLGKLDETKKAMLALVSTAVFAFSLGVATALAGFWGLPAQVQANTAVNAAQDMTLRQHARDLVRLTRGDSTIVCLLTLPDTIDRFQARRACP